MLDMLERTDSPSYGYQLAKDATSLTEAWDANPSASQDHFMLGHAEKWFYRGLGGLTSISRPKAPTASIAPSGSGAACALRYPRARPVASGNAL
jgi:hypothetical protein